MEETITITRAEYDSLKEDQELLLFIQDAGVDNWEGYSYALENLAEWRENKTP